MSEELGVDKLGVNTGNEWAVGAADEERAEASREAREARLNRNFELELLRDIEATGRNMADASEILNGGGAYVKTDELIKKIGVPNFMMGVKAVADVVEKNPGHDFGVADWNGEAEEKQRRAADVALTDAFVETVRGQAMVDGVSQDEVMSALGFESPSVYRQGSGVGDEKVLEAEKSAHAGNMAELVYVFVDSDAQKIMEQEVPRDEGEANADYNTRSLEVKKAIIGEVLADIIPEIEEQGRAVAEAQRAADEAQGRATDASIYGSEEYKKAVARMNEYNQISQADKREIRHKHHKMNVAMRKYEEARAAFWEHVRERGSGAN